MIAHVGISTCDFKCKRTEVRYQMKEAFTRNQRRIFLLFARYAAFAAARLTAQLCAARHAWERRFVRGAGCALCIPPEYALPPYYKICHYYTTYIRACPEAARRAFKCINLPIFRVKRAFLQQTPAI